MSSFVGHSPTAFELELGARAGVDRVGGRCSEYRSLQKSAGEVKSCLNAAPLPSRLGGVSVVVNANASIPSRTPADGSPDVPAGIANADLFNG